MEVSKSKFITMLVATLVVIGIVVGSILLSNCSINKSNVSIYLNDQLILSTNVNNGQEMDLDKLEYEGYKILGIYDNPEFNGEKITGKITINKNTSLYLNAEKLYRIVLQGYNSSSVSIYGSVGDVIKMPTEKLPTKEHAKLLGFSLKGDLILSPTLDYTIKEEDFTNFIVNFAPVWDDAKTIVLKVGERQTVQYIYAGEDFTFPHACQDGKYISSWTSSSGTIYDADQTITILDNMTLTAIMSPCKYTLKFDTAGGSTIENMNVTYGSSITLPTPTKTGYTFSHWLITLQNGTKVKVSGTIQVPDLGENGEKTLTAVWTQI